MQMSASSFISPTTFVIRGHPCLPPSALYLLYPFNKTPGLFWCELANLALALAPLKVHPVPPPAPVSTQLLYFNFSWSLL